MAVEIVPKDAGAFITFITCEVMKSKDDNLKTRFVNYLDTNPYVAYDHVNNAHSDVQKSHDKANAGVTMRIKKLYYSLVGKEKIHMAVYMTDLDGGHQYFMLVSSEWSGYGSQRNHLKKNAQTWTSIDFDTQDFLFVLKPKHQPAPYKFVVGDYVYTEKGISKY